MTQRRIEDLGVAQVIEEDPDRCDHAQQSDCEQIRRRPGGAEQSDCSSGDRGNDGEQLEAHIHQRTNELARLVVVEAQPIVGVHRERVSSEPRCRSSFRLGPAHGPAGVLRVTRALLPRARHAIRIARAAPAPCTWAG